MQPIIRLVAFVVALLVFPGCAFADQTSYANGAPIVLTIPVTASVAGSCNFSTAPSGTYNKDNFDQSGFDNRFNFVLNCSSPARVAVTSGNGGLLNNSAATATGYSNKSDYAVTLNLAANDGSTVQATCQASALQAGSGCAFAGTASTTSGLRLAGVSSAQTESYLRVSAPTNSSGSVLVDGSYADSLTITVSPSI